ncbi:Fe-S cluster assembly sulfur transfer protein SufU [Oribacterium sp. WCC10]|uniref:Fe-S cluster assembly sulfur transfer protein SufU n=1 Tax=Oribacterium sp. WCC10 TaxID=1855343 RepID=UPI0008EFC097|nr:SUF system NifU family Fe-S cluster assembly protein [Oribacterium sp. WCC10]SFG42292.1 nitrogen fixation protein NifU [Oribacterium sp. WCC10]
MANTFYNEILTDHNIHPTHKYKMEDATYSLEGVNPSCGDDVVLYIKVDDSDNISEASFYGDGCAISQASADMMCDLIIGKNREEALRLSDIFLRMIKDTITPEEKEELEEAGILEDIHHMPARVKCAVLGWHTMSQIFEDADNGKIDKYDGKFEQ